MNSQFHYNTGKLKVRSSSDGSNVWTTGRRDFPPRVVKVTVIVSLSNRPHFLWVYRRDNPRGMLGEHEKSL